MTDTTQHSDVLILGGGLAGLAAADSLRNSGMSVTLLESSSRLGGRTHGEYWAAAGRKIDMGGTWLLPPFDRTFELLKDLGINTIESPDSDLWLTHFASGAEVRHRLTGEEHEELVRTVALLTRIVTEADGPLTAEEALQRASAHEDSPSQLIEGWTRAMQRYLAGAPLHTVDSEHLLLAVEDIADPEHYHTQVDGTTQALIDALAHRITATVHVQEKVVQIERKNKNIVVHTASGKNFSAEHVIVAIPLNCLKDIRIEDELLGNYDTFIEQGHVGASRKDWLILDGVSEHFRVFGSHGPYGYFRSEEKLADGGILCVGLTPSAERNLHTPELQDMIRANYLPDATIREQTSHDWNGDDNAQGAWFVPRPGQYAKLPQLKAGQPNISFVGGDLDETFPGTIEGAVSSGQRAAAKIADLVTAKH